MKKKNFILLTVVLVVCLIIGITIYSNYEWLYTRCYFGNRVEGVYSVTVEGKDIEVTAVEYEINGEEANYKANDREFSAKNGEYGIHKIRFVLNNNDLYSLTGDKYFNNNEKTIVGIDYFNTNWWHIFKLDVKLNLAKTPDGWVVETHVSDDFYPFKDDSWYVWEKEVIDLGEFVQLGP